MRGRRQRAAVALAAVAVAFGARPVSAGDQPRVPLVSDLWSEIRRLVAAAAAPAPEPPKPVEVKWKSRRITSVDLGAPLLALAAADVDADGAAELIALTTREVLVLETSGKRRVSIAARAALPDELAQRQSRDPVGALAVGGSAGAVELYARTSIQASGVVLRWRDGALERADALSAFPMCARASAKLASGRNYFVGDRLRWTRGGTRPAVPGQFYAAACASLVDATGRPMELFGAVDTDGTLVVQRTDGAGERREVRKRGAAFAIADVDNDGTAEVITTTNRAPGRGDQVHVYGVRDGAFARISKSKKFTGGVAGIAVGDIDGDGDRDAVAAVRLVGSNRVDLWALNRP